MTPSLWNVFISSTQYKDSLQQYEDLAALGVKHDIAWDMAHSSISDSKSISRHSKLQKYQPNIYNTGYKFEYDDPNEEWSVQPKYENMKEEVLNNTQSVSLMEYQNQLEKTMQYMLTQYVMELQQKSTEKILDSNHILSVLFWCNFTIFNGIG